MNDTLLIGGHVSAAGGIENAPERAKKIRANVAQIFSCSPRLWSRKPITDASFAQYTANARACGIEKTVIHTMYLINLASDRKDLVEHSMDAVMFDLETIVRLDGVGVVVHVGSYQQRGWDAVKEELVETLSKIVLRTPSDSVFLIENASGSGGKIGSRLDEIAYLLENLGTRRFGWCLDTCHAHAAGYRLAPGHASPHSDQPFIFDEIDRLKLWDGLRVIHVNESKDPFLSLRDRHENLGEGKIGDEAMKNFLADQRIRSLPLVLEVPGIKGEGPDRENIQRLRELAGLKRVYI